MLEKDICLVGFNVNDHVADYILSDRNLGLALLAASLRKNGYSATIINPLLEDLALEETFDRIGEQTYKYFGFSILDYSGWLFVKKLIVKLREAGYRQKFILGGNYPTVYYDQVFKDFPNGEIDYICRGEGEYFIVEILDKLEGGGDIGEIDGLVYKKDGEVLAGPVRANILDLNTIPLASDDELENCKKKYQPVNLFSSRGCYGNCVYCSSNKLFFGKGRNKWRYREPQNVVDEIEILVKKYGIPRVSFMDDNFIGPGEPGKRRAIEICEEIKKRGLKLELFMECRPDGITPEVGRALAEAGFKLIFLGIESGSDNSLKELKRGNITRAVNRNAVDVLAANKVEVSSGFIMFTPNCSFADLRDNITFLRHFFGINYRTNILTMRVAFLPFSDLVMVRSSEIRALMEKEVRYLNNDYMYVSTDPDVQLMRYIIHDYTLYEYVYGIEEDIRKAWMIPEIMERITDESQLAVIKGYETELINLICGLLETIMQQIEHRDIKDLYRIIFKFKKQLILFATKKKKQIRPIIARYRDQPQRETSDVRSL